MAKLDACKESLDSLLETLTNVNQAYQEAKACLTGLNLDPDASTVGVGLQLVLGDNCLIPVPLPPREELTALVHEAVAFLSREIVRLWSEIHEIAAVAKSHCDAAASSAREG